MGRVDFPYVPGLLSFRELPALLPAVRALSAPPQLIMADGQGLAHPRSFGIASHLGVVLGIPTVGCAKSRLVGAYEEPGDRRGDWSRLLDGDRCVGAVLRTRDGVKPLFISVGHLIDLDGCVEAVLRCGRGYRLPEPQRLAHSLTARLKAVYREGGLPALEAAASSLPAVPAVGAKVGDLSASRASIPMGKKQIAMIICHAWYPPRFAIPPHRGQVRAPAGMTIRGCWYWG